MSTTSVSRALLFLTKQTRKGRSAGSIAETIVTTGGAPASAEPVERGAAVARGVGDGSAVGARGAERVAAAVDRERRGEDREDRGQCCSARVHDWNLHHWAGAGGSLAGAATTWRPLPS